MAHAAHHPLFDRPRIRAATQHFEIVIGFNDQHVAFAQVVTNACRHVAEVGDHSNFGTLRAKREAHGIGGIVRNGERRNCDIGDLK